VTPLQSTCRSRCCECCPARRGVASAEERRARQAAERMTAGPEWRGKTNGYVFTTALGEPVYPDTVLRLMLVLIKRYKARQSRLKAGRPLPVARLHDLRHVHATTLLRAGVPVRVVAARLAHADPSITLRVLHPRDQRAAGRGGSHLRPRVGSV
jgi:integrase